MILSENYPLTEGKITDYIRKQCIKRPKLCSAIKIAGSVAGATLILKGAMNYQQVQTMECYKTKPMFKSKYNTLYSAYQIVVKQYDKLIKERDDILKRLDNSPMTSSERASKKKELQYKIDVLKVRLDKSKSELDKLVSEVKDCSTNEKDIIHESKDDSKINKMIKRLKKKYSCDNPKNVDKLRCDPIQMAISVGALYGGYLLAGEYKDKWNHRIRHINRNTVTEDDLKEHGIKIPDEMKRYFIDFKALKKQTTQTA